MQSISFAVSNHQEFQENIQKARENGLNPTLAIVFASTDFEIEAIQKVFTENKIDLFGCTTAGEILDKQVLDQSAVCLLLDLKKSAYKLLATDHGGHSVYKTSFLLGQEAKKSFSEPGILLLSGGVAVNADEIVMGVKDGVGREIPFYGGQAGDDLHLKETVVFSNNLKTSNGLACLFLDTEIVEIKGMATSGWEAIGGENTVTEVVGNVLHGINDEPALDVFLKHFGFFDNTEIRGSAITSLSAQYPLQIVKDGYTVLRSPVLADFDNRTLTLSTGVEMGQKFRFSIAPGFEVLEKTVAEFSHLQQQTPNPDAVILFSCKGRHAAFGPLLEEEIDGLYNHWNTPMIGFFSYGEIGNTPSGVCEFHNETCSLVLLREK